MNERQTIHTLDREWGTGEFISVRRGDKYLGTEGVTYDLCECDTSTEPYSHSIVGSAVVTQAFLSTVKALSRWPETHAKHYNEACRTYDGLMTAMVKAYGDEFTDEATVTILRLRRTPTEESAP